VPPPKKDHGDDPGDDDTEHHTKTKIQQAIFDHGKTHIVRASALTSEGLVGAFEKELLSAGHAIIHDKIVVVDPLSADGFVAFGSHNLGYKASYMNDENLVIVRNNPTLIQAYMVHVLDVYDHYRFRAVQMQNIADGKAGEFDGFLSRGDSWLSRTMKSDRGALAEYLAQAKG